MPVNIDEDSQMPTFDSVKLIGTKKIPFILLLVVIIVVYIFLFTFLNNMSVDNDKNKFWILILEIILVVVLIIVVALNMDKLKNIHDTLFNYKNLYDKQKDLIQFFKTSNELNEEIYKEIHKTIEGYNKDIKAISIFENIRNTDIIKFNKIKATHDIKLEKILKNREVRLLEINTLAKNKKENIGKEQPNCCTNIIPL